MFRIPSASFSLGADATIRHNTATNGAAFYIDGVSSSISIGDNLLVKNNSATNAHVAWIESSTVDVVIGTNSRWEDNSCATTNTAAAGALSAVNTRNITFTGPVSFLRNTGQGGGAIFVQNAILNVPDDSSFIDNSARSFAGAILGYGVTTIRLGRYVYLGVDMCLLMPGSACASRRI